MNNPSKSWIGKWQDALIERDQARREARKWYRRAREAEAQLAAANAEVERLKVKCDEWMVLYQIASDKEAWAMQELDACDNPNKEGGG